MKSIRLKMIAKMHFRDTRINFPETVEKLYNPLCNNLRNNISQHLAIELINGSVVIYEQQKST